MERHLLPGESKSPKKGRDFQNENEFEGEKGKGDGSELPFWSGSEDPGTGELSDWDTLVTPCG